MLLEGHVPAQFAELMSKIIVTFADLYLNWINDVKDLSIPEAFDRDRAVKLDFAISVMLNVLQGRVLAKFCQNEWDTALLIWEADVHIVTGKFFPNRFLDISIAFDEALNLDLLLYHLLQVDGFLTDALLLLVDLSIELSIVF